MAVFVSLSLSGRTLCRFSSLELSFRSAAQRFSHLVPQLLLCLGRSQPIVCLPLTPLLSHLFAGTNSLPAHFAACRFQNLRVLLLIPGPNLLSLASSVPLSSSSLILSNVASHPQRSFSPQLHTFALLIRPLFCRVVDVQPHYVRSKRFIHLRTSHQL